MINDCRCQDSGAFSTLSCLGGILREENMFYKKLVSPLSVSRTHPQVPNLSLEGNLLSLTCYSSKVSHLRLLTLYSKYTWVYNTPKATEKTGSCIIVLLPIPASPHFHVFE